MIGNYFYFSAGIFLWISALSIILRKGDRAFYFLAGNILIMGLGIFARSLQANGQMLEHLHIYEVISPFQFLYGPFYFYFLLTFFRVRYQFSLKDALHLVPFVIQLIDYLPFYVLSAENKSEFIMQQADVSTLGIPVKFYNLLKLFSVCFYFILVGWFYFRYVYNTRFSDRKITCIVHWWLRSGYVLKLVALVSYVALLFFENRYAFSGAFYLLSLDSFLNIFMVFRYPLLLKGVQVEYDPGARVAQPSIVNTTVNKILYLLQPKTTEKLVQQKLHYLMYEQECFLDSKLNFYSLSEKINIQPVILEKYIKVNYGCTCDEYINFSRLEYLLNKLVTDSVWSESPIFKTVFKAGFDSVTSFQGTLMQYAQADNNRCFDLDKLQIEQLNLNLKALLS